MTARLQKNANNLRLRGCLLVLRRLENESSPQVIATTLGRVRRTLAACIGATDSDDENQALARQILRRMIALAAKG